MAISVGSVEVDVIPNTKGIHRRLSRELVAAGTAAGESAGEAAGRAFGPAMSEGVSETLGLRIGRDIGQQIAAQITASLRDAIRSGVTQGGRTARPAATKQGSETGGAFARAARARIEAAFRSLPDITVGADTSEADADLQALRTRMQALADKRIGVDIDAGEARAQITDIEEQLRRLGISHPNVTVRADTAKARAELAALRLDIDRISANPAHIRVETDGAFGQKLRLAVQQAEASLPNINIGANTGPAQAEIATLRGQLTALRDQRIGIDISTAQARSQIAIIQARLQALSAQDVDIAVRVDAAAAAAQLASVQAAASKLNGKRVKINISHREALRAILTLTVAIGALGAIPAVPVLTAGIGAIAAAATAAGAGMGALAAVAAPAVKDIAGALQAQKAAQDAATASTGKGGQTGAQAARQALQQAGAQQALAAAHRNAGRQIAQAEQGVQDAVRSAAQANAQAVGQVRSARASLAQAYEQAADRMRAANDQVRSAEQSLADAQRAARQAQTDLTQARRDAKAELQDLSNQLASAQLSERDATLSVQEAQARLRASQTAGARSTVIEQQRARLAYDQAVQRLKEQRLETGRLASQKSASDKAGVSGSATVRSAEERLAAARRAVGSQESALGRARQEMSRQQIQNSRDIAGAQQKVAQAQRNVATTQEAGARSVARAQRQVAVARQSAAESIASAERQVRSAELSSAGGANAAAAAQAKYQAALAKLTPSARGTFNAFVRLRSAFTAWSRALQPAVMPIFTRALNGMRNSLPGLTPLVLAAARGIKILQDRVSAGFKTPWWKTFKSDLSGSVQPALVGLGVSFGRIFKGMAGIIQAFLPHMDSISARMQRITGRFANWGTGLKGSPEFERFLDYSARMGPQLAQTFGDITRALFEMSRALSPLSGPLLEILGALARGLTSIATTLPWLIQGLYLVIIATKLWTLAMVLLGIAMKLNALQWIILAVVALVAAVIYAYKHFGWFRAAVQATWNGIKIAALYAWNVVLKPTFAAIWVAMKAVGTAAMWLWKYAILPAWTGIRFVIGLVWNYYIKPIFFLIRLYFRLIGIVAMWLWTNIIGPVFRNIGTIARWLMTIILVVLIGPWILSFKVLSAIVKWLWRNVVAPAFRGIAALGRWLWHTVLRPIWNAIKAGIRAMGAVFRWLYRAVVKPVFNGIRAVIMFWWRNVVVRYFNLVKVGLRALGAVFRWLRDKVVRPVFNGIKAVISGVWNKGIKPAFSALKSGVHAVATAFDRAKNAIKKAWDKLKGIAKGPVNFIINTVYSKGIKKVWDKVVSAFGGKKLPVVKGLARGGVLPGASSFRQGDDQLVPMRRGEGVYVSEAMRDPYERARLHAVNRAAMNGQNLGAFRDGGFAHGGTVRPPSISPQGFSLGGIFGGIGDVATGAWNGVKKGASWLKDTFGSAVRSGVKHVIDPMINLIPGKGAYKGVLKGGVHKLVDMLIGAGDQGDALSGGGPGVTRALKWAKSQRGKPYIWGGAGPKGFDCSGFMSSISKVIQGKKPWGRLWSTHSFSGKHAPGGWQYHKRSPFQIGITNSGVGHTAGTLAGTNVESRGGRGVVVGGSARGFNSPMFGRSWYGFKPAIGGGTGGKSPAAAQATARQMLGEFHFSQKQWPSLKSLWQKESGWRWNADNPSSDAYGIPQCHNLSTLILTRRGWLRHDEVRVGDETIGYNPATGRSEWTPVLEVIHPGEADLYRVGNQRFSATSTLNHRWLMQRMVNDKPTGEQMVELQHHQGRKHRLVLACPADTDSKLDISVGEAALLGWIAGDGWQVPKKVYPRKTPDRGRMVNHRPMTYHVCASRAKRWEFFEWLADETPSLRMSRERNGVAEWRMSAPAARDLTARAGGNPKTEAVAQVLAMSTEQREAWLEAMLNCDGYFGEDYTQVSQKAGPTADAITLAIYLSGSRPSIQHTDMRSANPVLTIGIVPPYVGMGHATVEYEATEEVWCVRTGLGTWTAQEDGRVFLTGNSLPGRKMRSAGADWKTNPATQIKWGLGYIRSRYKSPARAWSSWKGRSPHWYDEGGYLPPGMSTVYNGTGAPEPVLTRQQMNALTGAAVRGGDQPGLGDLQVAVFVGDREITDIARAEVRSANGQLVRTLRAGRG